MRPRYFYTGGISTYTYPHTIENSAGEQITFVRCVRDSAGDRLEVENLVKPDSGPPMHIHNYQPPPQDRGCGLPRKLLLKPSEKGS
jgi:hypothetical protein